MKEENRKVNLIKAEDKHKIVVLHAESLEDQIRFYINNEDYVVGIENEKKPIVKLQNILSEKHEFEKEKDVKERFKENLKSSLMFFGIFILEMLVLFCIRNITNNIWFYILLLNVIFYNTWMMNIISKEEDDVTSNLKSKHSAEHMMVNFLENNVRLPKDINELKKSSRFSKKCGRRKDIEKLTKCMAKCIVTLICLIPLDMCIMYSTIYDPLKIIIMFGWFYPIYYVLGSLVTDLNVIKNLMEKIADKLTCFIQFFSTTNNVNDEDFNLVYLVATAWIAIMYPEFYDAEAARTWK